MSREREPANESLSSSEVAAKQEYQNAVGMLAQIEQSVGGNPEKVDTTVASFIDDTQAHGGRPEQNEAGLVGFVEVGAYPDAVHTTNALGHANDETISYAFLTTERAEPGKGEEVLRVVDRTRLVVPERAVGNYGQGGDDDIEIRQEQGHAYIAGQLDQLRQLPPEYQEVIATQLVIDTMAQAKSGEVRATPGDLCDLVMTLPETQVGNLIQKQPEMMRDMVQWMSSQEINGDNFEAQKKTLRIAELMAGASMLSWRDIQRRGESVPEYVTDYIDKEGLATAVLSNRFDAAKLNEQGTKVAGKEEADHLYSRVFEAVDYGIDGVNNPDLRGVASQFLGGDIGQYDFQKTRQYIEKFVYNTESLGPQDMRTCHQRLGTVNFGMYQSEMLHNMVSTLNETSNHGELAVLLRGKNGDHNGAINGLTKQLVAKNMLIFEIGSEIDITKTRRELQRINRPMGKLSVTGHGDEFGLNISTDMRLMRYEGAVRKSPLIEIARDLAPNSNGERELALISCSQGRKWDGEGSLAQMMAAAEPSLVVRAADDLLYLSTGATADGRMKSWVDTRAEKAAKRLDTRRLEKSGKRSAVARLVRRFAKNKQKTRSVIVRQGKQKVDKSGFIDIGV